MLTWLRQGVSVHSLVSSLWVSICAQRAFLVEGCVLLGGLGLTSFCFFDEEPLLDFSDWSVAHCMLFLLGLFLAYSETSLRARYGQDTQVGDVVLLAGLTSWLRLVNYARLVIFVIGFHLLTPLEAELMELVAVHSALGAWLGLTVVPQLLFLVGVGLVALLLQTHVYARLSFVIGCLFFVVGLLVVCVVLLAWDLVLLVASHPELAEPTSHYARSRAALNPSARLLNPDAADWHKPRARAATLRFEGLIQTYLSLFWLTALLEAAVAWGLLFLSVVREGQVAVSPARVALAMLWLKNVFFVFLLGWSFVAVVSLRVFFQTEGLIALG